MASRASSAQIRLQHSKSTVFKPCQAAQLTQIPTQGPGKLLSRCLDACLSCHQLREMGSKNLLRRERCTSRAKNRGNVVRRGFFAENVGASGTGPRAAKRPRLRRGASGTRGPFPFRESRRFAAGLPGPRSLGCPLRFGPPGVACSQTPAGQLRASPRKEVGGWPVRRCVAVCGRGGMEWAFVSERHRDCRCADAMMLSCEPRSPSTPTRSRS